MEGDQVDVAVPPLAFLADDAITQGEVHDHVLQFAQDEVDEAFHAASVRKITIAHLKKIYETGDVRARLRLITGRHRVQITENDGYPALHPDVALQASSGTLDFLLCVPRSPGFGAVIPGAANGLNFEWKLRVSRYRQFHPKHSKLGFDAEGAMLHVGTGNVNENFWMVFAPCEFFDDSANFDYTAPGTLSGEARLSWEHSIWATTFLAFALQMQGVGHVRCSLVRQDWDDLASKMNHVQLKKVTDLG